MPNSEYIYVRIGKWRMAVAVSELAEAMAKEGNLLLRVPSGYGK